MKRHRLVISLIAFFVVIVVAIGSDVLINKEELVYQYMLYDHIEYNGNDYYSAKDQYYNPSKESEQRGPVYLVYKSSRINYEKCNYAYVYTGYEGEEDEVYLFFDSALYIRGDHFEPSQ